ncbi:MAG: DUF3320 domain-containing protein [Bacteroidales bacterium]
MDTDHLPDLKVEFVYSPVINFSLQQNHVPIIRRFIVSNPSGNDLNNLKLQLSFEPEFALPIASQISKIQAGESFQIINVDLKLSAKFLSELTERVAGSICMIIQCEDQILYRNDFTVDVLAFDQWQGIAILPEIVSSFITPNNPYIAKIIARASVILNGWTGSPSLDEYQSRNPDRVKKQMAAVFESIRELGIIYCAPPASFEQSGQRIRMIDTLVAQKLGTCLDLSLIYASCLEAIGIHPILVVLKGHAFAGGWLIDDSFADSISDDPSLLSKRIADGINEVLLVESTCMNVGNSATFDDAVRSGNYHLVNTDDFVLFVDVKRSRFAGIRPLPQRIKTESGWEFIDDPKYVSTLNQPDEVFPDYKLINQMDQEVSKQQLWERKLLDLSLRNNLLNTRITKSTVQLISVSLNKLEDALAAGDEFQLLQKPLDWDNPLRNAGVYQALNQTDPIIDLVKNELSQKRLRTYLTESELVHGLTNLYRSSKLSLEENGANTLFLCLGLLKWFETPASEQPRFSPILLLPAEIIRKSALKGFVIHSREEDTLMNVTLLEMLRQDFGITIQGLNPLPTDESGVDIRRIFNIIRKVIMPQNRWDVEEQAILGTFSFSKFIMWNDIHNNANKLIRNKIVSSLISGKAEWDVESNQFTEEELDKKYHPSEIALPISADSSQLEAISAANQNKSFILHGPPGTGKSQTITNIIANALYNGKKVLFVAEKMAALSVVQKRLEAIGISPFCVELHSNKSKKSSLLEQFKRTTEIVRRTPPEDFLSDAERIHQLRNELNQYVEALHSKYHFGFSLFEAFSNYAAYPEYSNTIQFGPAVIRSLSKGKVSQWTEVAEELKAAGLMCGNPHNHPLSAIRSLQYSPQTRSIAMDLFDRYTEALKVLRQSIADVNPGCQIQTPVARKHQASHLYEICHILVSSSDVPASLVSLKNIEETLQTIIRISGNGIERNLHRDSLLASFTKDILAFDAKRVKAEWIMTLTKWFLPKFLAQNKIVKSLKPLAINKKVDKVRIVAILDDIIEYQKEQKQIDQQSSFIAPILGSRWQGGDGDWNEISNVCQTVLKLNAAILNCHGDHIKSAESRRSLSLNLAEGLQAFLSVYGSTIESYISDYNQIMDIENKLRNLLDIDFDSLDLIQGNYIDNSLAACANWKSDIDSLRDWVGWNQVKDKAIGAGLNQLVSDYENGQIQGEDVVNYFFKSLYRSCADYIIEQDKQLSSFNGKLFEEKIRKFRQLNIRFEKLTRDELYAKLASKIPSFTQEAAQSSEIGILQRNIRNGGRGTSIRKLFDTIPTLITRICPCMLMSPISVAQYIDVNNFKFDLIVFDEASQMPTCEAVGAIARGNNMIVVGDPKQMPPTNFFSSNNIDEENIEKEDLESILDDCLALSLPSKYLLWHYRSKHESLITFSNSQYYENSLLTFPSPDDQTTKVKFNHVKGFYDRGKTRQNSFEAKAVIGEIMHRLSDPELSKKSIGVVTFSSAQQILIDDMLTEAFKLKPDLEIVATESPEPIFIKNLENVQGDERDIILFSVGYGPDKDNKVNLNFGPLNREGGWRRLNVAVSRARYEMKVFSTLLAEQIDITRTASQGVAGLKAFLEFAEKGKTSITVLNGSIKPKSSGIVDQLASRLQADGYGVVTNIGCSGFKIDIGISNQERPSEYILGVLCDGLSYKESKTARDREIIQTEVLRLLGWNIHKIWSCDWWDNPDKVLNEIKQAIHTGKNPMNQKNELEDSQMIKAGSSKVPVAKYVESIARIPILKFRMQYQITKLGIRCHSSRPDWFLDNLNINKISSDISTVLEKEAPISKDLLCRRVLAAWSLGRIGSRIDAYFNRLFAQMKIKNTNAEKWFYWNENQNPDSYRIYRVSENESDRCDVSDIPPEEISNAVREVLENQISLNRGDLVKETARLFGFNRIGGNVESFMQDGIDKAVKRGFAKIEGDRVFHVE